MMAPRGIKQILRQGASVAATRLVLIAASFVSSIIVARALTVQERGRLGLLMAVAALAIQFGNLGLPVANTYLVARQSQLLGAVVSNSVRVLVVVCVVLAGLMVASFSVFSAWAPLWGVAGVMVWLVGVGGLAQMLAQNLMVGRFQFGVSNGVDVLSRSVAIVGMLALWAFGRTTASTFACVAALASFAATFWGVRRALIPLELREWDKTLSLRQLSVGSRAYISCLASFVLSRLPLYAVESRGGLNGLAYYTQALVVCDTMLVVPTALGMVLFPNLAAADDAKARVRSTLRLVVITVGIMMAGVVTAILVGPRLLPFVYGRAYAASMPVLVAMLPGVAALGVCSVMQNSLGANGYPWAAVASPVIGVAAVSVGLYLSHTLIGAGYAYSVGGVVMLCCSSIGWWFYRNNWTEVQKSQIEMISLPD